MNCYFCKNELPNTLCNKCATVNQLDYVYHNGYDANISITLNDIRYVFFYNIKSNETTIKSYCVDEGNYLFVPQVMKMEGCTFNPSNVKTKVITYVLFK